MPNQDARSSLAEAVREPLRTGGLESALHGARAFFMRHPGDDDAKRVVEALELMMAQVWFGGADDGGAPDAAFAEGAELLARGDLAGAIARYESIEDETQRAARLALSARVIQAAVVGEPLPAAAPVVPAVFDDSTRVAGDGELPLAAFAMDDVTSDVRTAIPPEAYPEEPTRMLVAGEYEILDEEDERTRILQPRADAPVDDGTREVTRVARAGELPLEELRREIEADVSKDLDALLDSIDDAPSLVRPEPSLVLDITVEDFERESKVPRGPSVPLPPVVDPPETSAPTPPRDASVPDAPPAVVVGSRSESLLPFAPVASVTTPEARPHRPSSPDPIARESMPALESVPAPPPAPPPVGVAPAPPSVPAVDAPSSVPPPAPLPVQVPAMPPTVDPTPAMRGPAVPAPPRGPAVPPPPVFAPPPELSRDPVHAPLDSQEVALPAAPRWEIREPGADAPSTADHEFSAPVQFADPTWTGVRALEQEPATFAPGAEPVDADTWDAEEPTSRRPPSPEHDAEEHLARGELKEALRIYQELASARPDQPHLWDRVAEIARMLQQRSRD